MKKALIIGCNYRGTNSALNGCINDTLELHSLLQTHFGYDEDDIVLMTDDTKDKFYPSRSNIIYQIQSFIEYINNNSVLEAWISFSGHGSYLWDTNNDEIDGKDECIVPLDYNKTGMITDDILLELFSNISNKDCKLFCMFDCCHSGTILDLKHTYYTQHKPSFVKKELKQHKRRWRNTWFLRQNHIYTTIPEEWLWNHKIESLKKQNPFCDIVLISGCRDPNTSADAYDPKIGKWGGALTNSFIKSIKNCKNIITFKELTIKLNKYMIDNKYQQRPVLSSNNKIDDNKVIYKNKDLSSFIE